MKQRRERTEQEDWRFLSEVRAFSDELRTALARVPHRQANDRCGVSAAAPKLLLDTSLDWVKRFLVHRSGLAPQTPEETSEQAYALWLFSSIWRSTSA